MKKRITALALTLCLAFTLAACGEPAATESKAPAPEPTDSAAPETELTAYEIEGVGTVYLPAGGEVYLENITEPLPTTQCGVNFGDATLHIGIMGPDAYETAGVALPETVEEFSQRSGPQSDVPEGSVFAYDDYGNYYTEFTRDGTDTYYTLRVGADSTYGISLIVPEGTMADYSPGEWIAMIEFI